jgi:protein-disulfide isomerase
MSPTHHVVTLAVPVTPTDHIAGPERARVTVVEYGDFECPTCAAVEPAARQLRELHPANMAFVFRHYPLEEAHPHALMAAEASEAAAAQGKFWPMHALLFANQNHLSRNYLDGYAMRLDLDIARFKAEMDDEVYRQRIREHQQGGQRSHIRGTPTFFVNGVVQDVSGGMRELFDLVAAELRRPTR